MIQQQQQSPAVSAPEFPTEPCPVCKILIVRCTKGTKELVVAAKAVDPNTPGKKYDLRGSGIPQAHEVPPHLAFGRFDLRVAHPGHSGRRRSGSRG